jgi:soluble lytic murein transglycosylase-like protein
MIILIFTFLLLSGTSFADYTEKSLLSVSERYEIPPEILRAVCMKESGMNSSSINRDDGGIGNHAFGMCQVLYSTASWLGFRDTRCRNDFKVIPRIWKNCKLFGVKYNLRIAARLLRFLYDREQNWTLAVASYNSGTPRRCTRGSFGARVNGVKKRFKCTKGKLINHKYLEGVEKHLPENMKHHINPNI